MADRDPRDGVDARKSVPPSERRSSERFDVTWAVDCKTDETFLFASITNISEMGIFVQTREPLALGTVLNLTFSAELPKGQANGQPHEAFVLRGVVRWINPVKPGDDNPNPGMGIQFHELSAEQRERLVETVRTIAYLRDEPDSRPS